MKSDIDIKDDIYNALLNSSLVKEVNGKLYKRKRPLNSTSEDVVISVLANNMAQRQMAYINVNVYVKDDYVKTEDEEQGQDEEQSQRLRKLCQLAIQSVNAIRGKDYRVTFDKENGQRVIESEGEHIINNRLLYQIINEEL